MGRHSAAPDIGIALRAMVSMSAALHALPQRTAPEQTTLSLPPSPTLTNPDNILPSADRDFTAATDTGSRVGFARGPPSPSYLRERSSPRSSAGQQQQQQRRQQAAGGRDMAGKDKERLGLMSKKMMLLRSRTASNSNLRDARRDRNVSHGSIDSDYTLPPPEPVLQDVGNLAGEQLQLPEREIRRKSGSSSGLSGMADFLAKYAKPESPGSDDDTVDDNAPQFESIEVDAQRRKQELEEYNSAVLSKRAEEILANAKKRLNVMEGNLRGARDLVAPLTAANLKRATSLGSAGTHYSPGGGASYNSRVRYIPQPQHYNNYDRDTDHDQPVAYRTLHSQASTPAMGRHYQHTRNFSEVDLPDRPLTSLEQHHSGVVEQSRSRTPSRTRMTESPTQTPGLRGSKSYGSLGVGRDHPLHNRASPDPNHMEALPEGDEVLREESSWTDAMRHRYHHQSSLSHDTNSGQGYYRPSSRASSRTSDLREQMSSLKGKISTLKERAREDSLRRKSQASLRTTETTPFNNAESAAPEFFYNPGAGDINRNEALEAQDARKTDSWVASGSRNAFAEQAGNAQKHHIQCARVVEIVAGSTAQRRLKVREVRTTPSPPNESGRKRSGTTVEMGHKRMPSGIANLSSTEQRYSDHQLSSIKTPGRFRNGNDVEDMLAAPPSPPSSDDGFASSPLLPGTSSDDYISKTDSSIDDDYAPSDSDAGESVYEDAPEYEGEGVVPHEHREDAFDYESFFLTNAMARYNGQRRASQSSTGSMSSTETARGPVASTEDGDMDDGYSSDPGARGGVFPPPTPQTPERLRAIEREFAERQKAMRPLSEESTSTMNSFATAREGSDSFDEDSEEDGASSPPVSPISASLNQFSGFLGLPHRPVSPLSDPGQDGVMMGRQSPQTGGAELTKQDPHVEPHKTPSLWTNGTTSPNIDIDKRPGTAVRLRRSSSSDRADSGIGSETRSTVHMPQQASTAQRYGQPSRDVTSVVVNALLDPKGVGLGLRDNALLFGVVESLRHVVRELQRQEEDTDGKEEMSREMRMLMMRRRLERARGALDGGFGGA